MGEYKEIEDRLTTLEGTSKEQNKKIDEMGGKLDENTKAVKNIDKKVNKLDTRVNVEYMEVKDKNKWLMERLDRQDKMLADIYGSMVEKRHEVIIKLISAGGLVYLVVHSLINK